MVKHSVEFEVRGPDDIISTVWLFFNDRQTAHDMAVILGAAENVITGITVREREIDNGGKS